MALHKGWGSHLVALPTGATLHYVSAGKDEKGVVVFVHGWPEFWYSWRHQIDPVAAIGYKVIVIDQRGIGKSKGPAEWDQYGIAQRSADLIALLDHLGIKKAVFIGHDWGSPVVWSLALHYQDRVAAVGSHIVAFGPPNPAVNTQKAVEAKAGPLEFWLYFQEDRAAVELQQNVRKSLKVVLRTNRPEDKVPYGEPLQFGNTREKGGILVGWPDEQEFQKSVIFTDEEFQAYVDAYTHSGFSHSLAFYKNLENDWNYNLKAVGKKIEVPVLMITAGQDKVFPKESTAHMEKFIPNLTRGHIEDAGHWIEEQPEKLTSIIVDWLQKL